MNKTITYTFAKATKNTYQYQNEEAGAYYLPKTFFTGPAPTTINVTITTSAVAAA